MNKLDTLSKRLNFLLSPRRPNPWGAEIGLSSNMITRMCRDETPGIDALMVIQMQEYISMRWLLEGSGNPFQTNFYVNDDDLKNQLVNQTHQARNKKIIILTDLQFIGFIFESTQQYVYQKRDYNYLNIDIYSSYFNHNSLKIFETLKHYGVLQTVYCSHHNMKLLCSGWLGTFALFGNSRHVGLIERSKQQYPDFKLTALKLSVPNNYEPNTYLTSQLAEQSDEELLNLNLISEIHLSFIEPLKEEGVALSPEKISVITSTLYCYCIRSHTDPKNIDTYTALMLLEALDLI